VVGSGVTSAELAAGGLKDIIVAPAGAFDNADCSEVAVQFAASCRGKQRTVRAAEPGSTDNRQLGDLTGSFTSIDGVF
jgi:hypothetical protein